MTTTAVLLMAYGSPETPGDVRPYLQDIRGGREPTDAAVEELASRYAQIGGRSPLLDITRAQANALADELGDGFSVHVGMKHWHPFVRDAVSEIDAARVVGLALAPHYAAMSIGGYEDRLRRARDDAGKSFDVVMVQSWYEESAFIELAARNLCAALDGFDGANVIFTAHSLPARILEEGDPYADQLNASSKLIADRAGVDRWEFAFQSASATGVPWLGPDVGERLQALRAAGVRRVVVAPIGFVSDHLEILYDVDVVFAGRARALGMELRRVASPNDDPLLAKALAGAVRRAAA